MNVASHPFPVESVIIQDANCLNLPCSDHNAVGWRVQCMKVSLLHKTLVASCSMPFCRLEDEIILNRLIS